MLLSENLVRDERCSEPGSTNQEEFFRWCISRWIWPIPSNILHKCAFQEPRGDKDRLQQFISSVPVSKVAWISEGTNHRGWPRGPKFCSWIIDQFNSKHGYWEEMAASACSLTRFRYRINNIFSRSHSTPKVGRRGTWIIFRINIAKLVVYGLYMPHGRVGNLEQRYLVRYSVAPYRIWPQIRI